MCGIAGIVAEVGSISTHICAEMGAAINHRGPDDQGLWCAQDAVLIHRRLSILDLTQCGHQPMLSICGRYVMTYNGEIYNYEELRSELEAHGVKFRGTGDSEVLLAAYVQYGIECLKRLNGMWAFAIWDRQEQTLFASRDRFGKKPFYYAQAGDKFLFASEIKAILATGLVRRVPNPGVVADFCSDRVSDHTDATFFVGIRQLTPGSWGLWRKGEFRTGVFWSLPLDADPMANADVEGIRDLLDDAVRIRLRADTQIGTLLSGGIDSSTVACLAANHCSGTLNAFSTIGEDFQDESLGIDLVTRAKPNIVVHKDQPTLCTLEEELDSCLWHQEEPFADGSMVAHFRLMRLARQRGTKVLLTGQGADEVFAGYPGHLAAHTAGLVARGAWTEALRFARAVGRTGQRLSLKGTLGYALPPSVSRRLRTSRVRRALDWIDPALAQVNPSISGGYVDVKAPDPLNHTLREGITQRTLPAFLHYDDRNSMAFGVETRSPFLDHRLVSKVLPLAGRNKVRHGFTKALLREAVKPEVPHSIVARAGKQGYPAPLAQWLRTSDRDTQHRWMRSVSECPLIRVEAWRRRHRRFVAGDDGELAAVWRGLILALWYDRFIVRAL